jgi:hypothetical protein
MSTPTLPSALDMAAAIARVRLASDNWTTYVALLQTALVDYGRHQHGCPALYYDGPCACGFTAALHGLIPREQREAARCSRAGAAGAWEGD